MIWAYYALILFACGVAVLDFRRGIYLALLVDLLRDVVRKATPGESVFITLIGVAVWGAVFAGVAIKHRRLVRMAFQMFPDLRRSVLLLIVAVAFAAALATIQYRGGYRLALVGFVSYLMPLAGLAIGFAFPRNPKQIANLMRFYVIINSIYLIGVPLEYFGYEWRTLGGMHGMHWIRYRQGYIVDLMSGFYRSPDIMGLHAANTMMFCLSLLLLPRSKGRLVWILLAIWSAICLLLGGRRKMIGMPFVFLATWLVIGRWTQVVKASKTVALLSATGAVLVIAVAVISQYDPEKHYSTYASTLPNEGVERSLSVFGASLVTLRQSGIIGAGLGTATQGNYYVGGAGPRSWQEDGLSRLFLEFGLFGVSILAAALVMFLRSFGRCFRLTRPYFALRANQVLLLACVAANGASFLISHQQFSGDPGSAIIVLMLLGMTFGICRLQPRRRLAVRAAVAPRIGFETRPVGNRLPGSGVL